MKFRFKIQEKATYVQTGTVSVDAPNEDAARKLVCSGYYEHDGDNEINYDTEKRLSTIITEILDVD